MSAPGVESQGQDTCVQKERKPGDFGVFGSPDALCARHGANLAGVERWLYGRVTRLRANRNVALVRAPER